MPFPVIVEEPKLFDPFSVRVPAPFIESKAAVTFDAKVEEFAAVIASALLIESALLMIKAPVPLLVKELAAMFDPVKPSVPLPLVIRNAPAATSLVTLIAPLVPKVTLSPVVKKVFFWVVRSNQFVFAEAVSQIPLPAALFQSRFAEFCTTIRSRALATLVKVKV